MKPALFFILLAISLPAFSQDKSLDFYIVANANLYLPGSASEKEVYPIVGYNKATEPKVLIGGFGVGALAFKTLNEKLKVKGQVNFSKLTYWDAPQVLTGGAGDPVDNYFYGTSDYILGFNATMHYTVTEKLRLGTGVGAQVLLSSKSKAPDIPNTGSHELLSNRYYKPIMPVVPLEISYLLNRLLLSIRYEQALLNKLSGELSDYKDERFGVLYFEIGFAL